MDTVLSVVLGFAIMLGVPVYLGLQVWTPLAVRGTAWRVAALAPLIVAMPLAAWCLWALAQESNLWPLPFILFAPLGCLYLGGLLAVRAIARAA